MHKVYALMKEKPEIINLKEKFQLFQNGLFPKEYTYIPSNENEIKDAIHFDGTHEEFDQILESVSHEMQLSFEDDVEIKEYDKTAVNKLTDRREIPPEALKLNVIKNSIKANEKLQRRKELLKYNKNKFLKLPELTEEDEPDIDVFGDFLLTIRFYFPFKRESRRQVKANLFAEEFAVLGSQYLSELRDKIHCMTCNGPFFDISEQSTSNENQCKKQVDSGFLFIHDTFYNDFRDPAHVDYSKEIISWYRDKAVPIEFRTAKLEKTKFNELKFILGQPQVYQHHGNCEHIFSITDVQLIAKTDCLVRKYYPLLTSIALSRFNNCYICNYRKAEYIVKECVMLIHDPTLLCSDCYSLYLFVDDKKACDFKSYVYHENDFNFK